MSFYRLDSVSESSIKPERLAALLHGLDQAWNGDTTALLAAADVCPTKHDASLGTIGGGNHFAEIQIVDHIVDPVAAERVGIKEGKAYLLGT